MSSDFWAITCYFNPCRYRTKRLNYDLFREGMKKSGANLLVVELAFGDEEFELEPGDGILQLRGGGVMWQKERLLNIAAATLPKECRKVAWLDNDLIFDDPRWFERTSEALDRYKVVQPFSSAIRMARDHRDYASPGETYESFGHAFRRTPRVVRVADFVHHGHTGFAWAARRELFEDIGLYDVCLTGSGDHLMSHGFSGGVRRSRCLPRMIGKQPRYLQHYLNWADKARVYVNGELGYVPGTVLHLWHGDLENRNYARMNLEFATFDFDPNRHLRLDENGLFEWSDEAPKRLRDWADRFFWIRREDGDPADEEVRAAVA